MVTLESMWFHFKFTLNHFGSFKIVWATFVYFGFTFGYLRVTCHHLDVSLRSFTLMAHHLGHFKVTLDYKLVPLKKKNVDWDTFVCFGFTFSYLRVACYHSDVSLRSKSL